MSNVDKKSNIQSDLHLSWPRCLPINQTANTDWSSDKYGFFSSVNYNSKLLKYSDNSCQSSSNTQKKKGVVGWCEGAVYLRSPGRPTDIGLQLGKACYPCSG